jgi:hypothetical protein
MSINLATATKWSILWLAALAAAGPVFAICPEPWPRPCGLFHKSKAAFIGTIVSESQAAGDNRHDPWTVYTVKVLKSYKGNPTATVKVFSENNSGREVLEVGTTYLIFADGGDRKHPLVVSCRLTAQVRDIKETENVMDKVVHDQGSVVISGLAETVVPAGEYHISAETADGRPLRQSDYNFLVDTNRIIAGPGECVDLIFVPKGS